MFHLDLSYRIAQERYNDLAAELAHDRQIAAARAAHLPLTRRVARPLGRQLMRLSLLLLRYGHIDAQPTTVLYRASVGSVELN